MVMLYLMVYFFLFSFFILSIYFLIGGQLICNIVLVSTYFLGGFDKLFLRQLLTLLFSPGWEVHARTAEHSAQRPGMSPSFQEASLAMETLVGGLRAVAVYPPAFSRTLFHHQFPSILLLISPFSSGTFHSSKNNFLQNPILHQEASWKRSHLSPGPHPCNCFFKFFVAQLLPLQLPERTVPGSQFPPNC